MEAQAPTPKRSKRSKKAGLAPGSLIHIGEKKTGAPEISVFHYGDGNLEELSSCSIDECLQYKDKPGVSWINVDGVHDVSVIEKLGKHYDLHVLTLEDILNTDQRPKQEDFGAYLYVVLKMLHHSKDGKSTIAEQVSLIVGRNFLLSFQEDEREGDVFNHVRTRLRSDQSRLRRLGSDYLAYALMDSIIDHYFVILETIGEEIERLENRIVQEPAPELLPRIHALKREMLFLRRSTWPLREVISGLQREETHLITSQISVFLKDLYDHSIQVMDTIETYREMLSGMLDVYLSSVSNKMNSVMKVLTLIATIFMPLTFIVGIYGMNFDYMPELRWKLGYAMIWGIILLVTGGMLVFFRRRDWI